MGWSYSDDQGSTWTYGGKVAPPAGWAILWGDPAITVSRSAPSVVFLSNLAVPLAKYPDGGLVDTFGGTPSPIGGACIAKSNDGGKTFGIHQCLSNTIAIGAFPDSAQGHFYDGGSMVSSVTGEIYAAYVDVYASQIDVYRAASETSPFVPMAPPFPGLVVLSHPRLRAGTDGTLYAAAQVRHVNGSNYVYLNRASGGQWGQPVLVSAPSAIYPQLNLGAAVQGQPLTLRTGPQFSFDVGAASPGGADAIRVLYTRQDFPDSGSPLYINGSACSLDLRTCSIVPGWAIGPSASEEPRLDVYNPAVVAWPGFFGLPSTWQGSFMERYGASTNTINVARMTLGYVNGVPLVVPVDFVKQTPICSDLRGYWGDYDTMLLAGFQGTSEVFLRLYTDSSAGCTRRWTYQSQSQHVSAATYTY